MMIPGVNGSVLASAYKASKLKRRYAEGGPVNPVSKPNRNTQLSSEDELKFQTFYKTLPSNLQVDNEHYDIRGYWDSLGRPNQFDYSQPKQEDGFYHAYSRHPKSGKMLKAMDHPTANLAIEGNRAAGYTHAVDPLGNVYSFSLDDLPTEGPFKVPQNTPTYQFKKGGLQTAYNNKLKRYGKVK